MAGHTSLKGTEAGKSQTLFSTHQGGLLSLCNSNLNHAFLSSIKGCGSRG